MLGKCSIIAFNSCFWKFGWTFLNYISSYFVSHGFSGWFPHCRQMLLCSLLWPLGRSLVLKHLCSFESMDPCLNISYPCQTMEASCLTLLTAGSRSWEYLSDGAVGSVVWSWGLGSMNWANDFSIPNRKHENHGTPKFWDSKMNGSTAFTSGTWTAS